jgi:MFS family permease
MDRQMLSTMQPSMQQDIRELQSATQFGWLMAIFLWVYGSMSPVAGFVADRFSRKKLIVASLFVWSGVTLAMGYAKTFPQLYGLRAIMGLSEALYLPAGLSLIADYHPSRTRSLAIGIHMTGIYIGQALGGYGALMAARFSWQETFQLFGCVGVIYSLVLGLFLRDKGRESTDDLPAGKIGPLFANVSFWIILFYFAVASLPGWAIKNWLPTLFSHKLDMNMTIAGPLSTITVAAASFLGVLFGGVLADRWSRTHSKGRIYTSVIGLGLTVPSLLLIGFGHSLVHVLAAAVFFGLGYGMFDANNMPILCQFVTPRQRATGYGCMNMTGVFAGAIITARLGESSDAGHLGRDLGLLALVVLVALALPLYFLHPKTNGVTNE